MDQPNYKFCSFLNNSQLQEVFSQNHPVTQLLSVPAQIFLLHLKILIQNNSLPFPYLQKYKIFLSKAMSVIQLENYSPTDFQKRGEKKDSHFLPYLKNTKQTKTIQFLTQCGREPRAWSNSSCQFSCYVLRKIQLFTLSRTLCNRQDSCQCLHRQSLAKTGESSGACQWEH